MRLSAKHWDLGPVHIFYRLPMHMTSLSPPDHPTQSSSFLSDYGPRFSDFAAVLPFKSAYHPSFAIHRPWLG